MQFAWLESSGRGPLASTADVEPVAEAKVAWGVWRGRDTGST